MTVALPSCRTEDRSPPMPVATAERSPLTAEQREAYDAQGFLVVRGVFTPGEIAEAADDAERLLQRRDLIDVRNLRCRWQPRCCGEEDVAPSVCAEGCLFET